MGCVFIISLVFSVTLLYCSNVVFAHLVFKLSPNWLHSAHPLLFLCVSECVDIGFARICNSLHVFNRCICFVGVHQSGPTCRVIVAKMLLQPTHSTGTMWYRGKAATPRRIAIFNDLVTKTTQHIQLGSLVGKFSSCVIHQCAHTFAMAVPNKRLQLRWEWVLGACPPRPVPAPRPGVR